MKNLSVILNVVLLIAVGVLYFLHFSDKNSVQGSEGAQTVQGGAAGPISIAYINSDSLVSNYEFFNDKAAELEEKRKKMEAEFTNRANGLQTEISNFQQNAGSMTQNQARAKEEDLMKKRENLMRYQESLSQDLAREESLINNQLYDNVSDYLKNYGKQRNFQVVLTYSKGSGVLYANDSLNITNDVINGLNQDYQAVNQSADSKNKETVKAGK